MNILEIKDVTYNYSNSREKVLSSVNQKFELGQFRGRKINITFIIGRFR